jgi:hypothetical protein
MEWRRQYVAPLHAGQKRATSHTPAGGQSTVATWRRPQPGRRQNGHSSETSRFGIALGMAAAAPADQIAGVAVRLDL